MSIIGLGKKLWVKCIDCPFEVEASTQDAAGEYARAHLEVYEDTGGYVNVGHRLQVISLIKVEFT